MNGIELFERVKCQSGSMVELITETTNGKTRAQIQSKQGNVFEKVCDMIIKCGFCGIFPNSDYYHYDGNINTCKMKKVDNLELYLQNKSVFGRGRGGSSDITLQHKNTNDWIFISCKYYLDDDKKSIDDYDVEKILAVIRQHSHKYKTFHIYLLVNNKEKVLNIINSCQTTNNYIKENICNVIGIDEMEYYFQEFKLAAQNIELSQINSRFCNSKIPLQLRFHQELITHKQMQEIKSGETQLLLGAKARSGKTYCVGGLFVKYYKQYDRLNALIITPAPTETMTQFTDDLFHKFGDFDEINIIEIKKGADIETIVLQENNIVIVSKQLLDDYVLERKIKQFSHLEMDFIVFDENHFHGTTQMSKNILQTYSCVKTVKLYLTATFAKPLNEWNIPKKCQFFWDIEDENLCKKRDICGLIEKQGNEVARFLTEENKERLLGVYDKMPELHIITNMMDETRYNEIKEKIQDGSCYGFSMSALLSGQYPNEVDTVLEYISGSNKEKHYPRRDLSTFGRIKRLAISVGSRTQLNNGDFTTQLWFLPFGVNMSISATSEHLKDRMLKNKILKKYEIKIVNSKKGYKVNDLKEEIKNWEIKAKDDGKDGLILLAGNQLTLGITLPLVDIVVLLNDTISSDKIYQMMYRCMTESMNTDEIMRINSGVKKIGFVVDFNISRVLNTCLDYNLHKKDLSVEQKIAYLVENNLINIDSDLFQSKENKTKLIEKLLQIWKTDPINNLKTLLKKIENECIPLDTPDQHKLNQCFTRALKENKLNITVSFDEENEQTLPTGREICAQNTEEDETTSVISKEPDVVDISLSKDVLPFIIPLSCILTINTGNNDILEMLAQIKENPALLEVFRDQSFIWWNKHDIINLVETIVEKYVKRSSFVYNIAIQFKMSLQSLIDNPKELLELIDSCLKPKQKEKQENGEVFTPMAIVFEMLDSLDKHYIQCHNKSIFSEPNLKWFDPAAGMGNFPVAVYLKLMEGLSAHFPDTEDRKKHILENMLYMSELNKKNVFVCRQIFDINNQYSLHLYEGNTLELDTIHEWGIDKFDIIMGNPPYNKGGIRSHTGKQLGEKNETIWTKFIEKSFECLKEDGYLLFINPLSWLKKSHSLHNIMLERFVVWLKLWDNSQSKGIINADIPISLYLLQNTKNTENETKIISVLKRRNITTSSFARLNSKYSIPLAYHNIFNKLTQYIEAGKLQLEYKTKTVKSTGTKTKIPSTYDLNDNWAVDTYTIKDGIMVKKTSETHPDANKQKLIISNKASFVGAFIDDGKLSLTGTHKFYILGENLELLLKLLSFKLFDIIGHFTKYGQDFLDNEAFSYIPDIRKLGILDITELELYNLIGFTTDEINQINPELLAARKKIRIVRRTVVAAAPAL